MNYLQYYPTDVVNGEGTRCTLFVSGCTHGCSGCYNQKSWSFDNGVLFDEAMEQQIINDLKDTRIKRQGLTLSGGDPMHPRNVEALLPFVQRVKRNVPIRTFGCGQVINWMNLMIINVKCCLILTCSLMENLYKNRLTQAWSGAVQPIK